MQLKCEQELLGVIAPTGQNGSLNKTSPARQTFLCCTPSRLIDLTVAPRQAFGYHSRTAPGVRGTCCSSLCGSISTASSLLGSRAEDKWPVRSPSPKSGRLAALSSLPGHGCAALALARSGRAKAPIVADGFLAFLLWDPCRRHGTFDQRHCSGAAESMSCASSLAPW
jgi:hypothetical protein